MTFLLISLIFFIIGAGVAIYLVKHYAKPVDVWKIPVEIPAIFSTIDPILRNMALKADLSNQDFENIFRYVLQGIKCYSSKNKAQIVYPGISGTRGKVVEGLEGFARTAVILASWLKSGRSTEVELFTGQIFYIEDHILSGLVNGTDRKSSEYWGEISNLDQRIVEAADIAIAIWLMKDKIKNELSESQIDRILNWLAQANHKEIYGGNWHLFLVIINCVLLDFGQNGEETVLRMHYNEFKEFHVGHGWFTDGKDGEIDYYNVWQMQYMLFWANEIQPTLDQSFIIPAINDFSEIYQYFIGPNGIPIFGRSCCYRLAAATPLIAAAIHHPDIWQGRARQALNHTWRYFLRNGALKNGGVTQGYFEDDEDLLENYSGRASPLWSLRSLSLAFYSPPDGTLWTGEIENLPIELSTYDKYFDNINIRVTGNYNNGEIIVFPNFKQRLTEQKIKTHFKRMSKMRKKLQSLFKRPLRINNYYAKYKKRSYRSSSPFFLNVDHSIDQDNQD